MSAQSHQTVRESIEKALQGKEEISYDVTPEMAKELLKETKTTKNISRKRINQFRCEILNGQWETIQSLSMEDVDKLAAIIEAGKTVRAYVRRDGRKNTSRSYKRKEIIESMDEMSEELSNLQSQIDSLRERL